MCKHLAECTIQKQEREGESRWIQRLIFTHNLTHQLFYFSCFALLRCAFSSFDCIRRFIWEHFLGCSCQMSIRVCIRYLHSMRVCGSLHCSFSCSFCSCVCAWMRVRIKRYAVCLCLSVSACRVCVAVRSCVYVCLCIHGESSTFWLLPLTTLAMTRC